MHCAIYSCGISECTDSVDRQTCTVAPTLYGILKSLSQVYAKEIKAFFLALRHRVRADKADDSVPYGQSKAKLPTSGAHDSTCIVHG